MRQEDGRHHRRGHSFDHMGTGLMDVQLPMSTDNSVNASVPWRVARVDIRSRITPGDDVVARVELIHDKRGRVTDLAIGPGGVEAAMRAIGQVIGLAAFLEQIEVTGRSDVTDIPWQVCACVTVRVGSVSVPGTYVGTDALHACCSAYLNAMLTAGRLQQATARNSESADGLGPPA